MVIEFALVVFQLMIVVLAGFEFCRMVLAYTAVANAARVATRYAITHGNNSAAPSGPTPAPAVVDVAKNYARLGLVDPNQLNVTVDYLPAPGGGETPGCIGCNKVGSRVRVTVGYPYDPWVGVLPLRVNLGSVSEGIITW